jgi:hypothetical protein
MASVRFTTSGNLSDIFGDVRGEAARAVYAGVAAAGAGLQLELRQEIYAAGLKTVLGNLIGLRVFPTGNASLRAVASIYARGPSADNILTSLASGLVIVPKRGRYLAIPTSLNRLGGRRGAGLRITPADMLATRQAFTIRVKSSDRLLWCLRVNEAASGGRGRVKQRAFAGGVVELGGGRRARVAGFLAKGFVPMFVLAPAAKMKWVLHPEELGRKWGDRVADLIDRASPAGAN